MCKILSLDGGGSWAVLQLLTLRDRYPGLTGHQILCQYDLVIANSGGSIVLACLVEDWTPEKALGLFREKGQRERIFSKNSFRDRFFPADYIPGIGPKYSSVRKGRAFREIFSVADNYMNDLPAKIGKPGLKLIVCTYDALNNRAKFFRSYGGNSENTDFVRLTQAIHGSSNAPIQYFDFPARFKASSGIWFELWDGALGGFNNPVTAGVIEAIKCGYRKEDISVVSLGTSNKYMSMADKERFYKVKQYAVEERRKKHLLWRLKYQLEFFKKSIVNQAKTILYEPPDWSTYMAFMFLFEATYHTKEVDLKRFVRLSPVIHTDSNTSPDAVALIETLYTMDMNLTTDEEIALVEQCYAMWKAGKIPNQTIEYKITRDNELIPVVGHPTWQDAFDDWI